MISKAWVSLLWSQYNRLSEPLKEGYISLVKSIEEEAKRQYCDCQNADVEGQELAEND